METVSTRVLATDLLSPSVLTFIKSKTDQKCSAHNWSWLRKSSIDPITTLSSPTHHHRPSPVPSWNNNIISWSLIVTSLMMIPGHSVTVFTGHCQGLLSPVTSSSCHTGSLDVAGDTSLSWVTQSRVSLWLSHCSTDNCQAAPSSSWSLLHDLALLLYYWTIYCSNNSWDSMKWKLYHLDLAVSH